MPIPRCPRCIFAQACEKSKVRENSVFLASTSAVHLSAVVYVTSRSTHAALSDARNEEPFSSIILTRKDLPPVVNDLLHPREMTIPA